MLAVALLAALVLLNCASAKSATIPPPACYIKKQKCCYAYGSCGYVPKKVEKKEDCPYRKCDDEYKTECYAVPKCETKKVQDGEDCREEPDPSGYGTVEKCYPKYVPKKYCVNENKCEKKKYTKCYNVPAYCVKYYYYEYPKYCAKLSCDKLYVDSGSDKAPSDYISPQGNVTKIEEGKRHDKSV